MKMKELVGAGSFGGSYDFDTNTLGPGIALHERMVPLRDRMADWLGVQPDKLVQVLVAEYAPGTPLGSDINEIQH